MSQVSGNIVDIIKKTISPGVIEIKDGTICSITPVEDNYQTYIIPGFIDSHIHIESSMLTPAEFARAAIVHGTVGAVCDPHEIANVLGVEGVRYMIDDGGRVPFKFSWGVPSCVPATAYETSGAKLGIAEVETLLKTKDGHFLSEVMNVPGVLNDDPEVIGKINIARSYKKVVDGHAPNLGGKELEKYISYGISTDHECLTESEALEKLQLGMKVLIREGSAAKNFNDLISVAKVYPNDCMFCSDDKHPDDLRLGHINAMIKKAVRYGLEVMDVLRIATLNPIKHYNLDVGLLREGDPADFLVIDNLFDFNILKTFINGDLVAENGTALIKAQSKKIVNNFNVREKDIDEFSLKNKNREVNVIRAIDGQLITERLQEEPKVVKGFLVSDPDRDILKIAVIDRYEDRPPSIAFVKNFGLKEGAIGSSVAHDSHNIVAVGVDDNDLCEVINLIIKNRGGIGAVCGEREKILPLPIAGIMSDLSSEEVAQRYTDIDMFAKELGSALRSPFMTLSFMALLVIPEIKLSDKGLFDGKNFSFIDLYSC